MYEKKNISMKVVTLVLTAVLVFGCAVGGTLAWLIAQTNTVTNTFAVGNITIDLEETVNGQKESAKVNAVANSNFKIVPGASEAKDPVVTVEEGSEACYVYVCVENNLVVGNTTVGTLNIDTSKWEVVGTKDNNTVYRYTEVVNAATGAVELSVFTTVSYADSITMADMTTLKDKTIVISAYAHQSQHVDGGIATTNAAALSHFGLSNS